VLYYPRKKHPLMKTQAAKVKDSSPLDEAVKLQIRVVIG
jgi:hypothetical protein